MKTFEYVPAESLDHALQVLEQHGDDARPIAGGTALVNLMKQQLLQPAVLVSLRSLVNAEARYGQVQTGDDGTAWVGALASHGRVAADPSLWDRWPLLAETFRRVATPRIRNAATVGGSLAHADPNQDPPAGFIALDAEIEAASKGGSRRIAAADFFTDYYETALQPGELVVGVHLPAHTAGGGWSYQKFLPRTHDDYATVAVAVWLDGDVAEGGACRDARIALVGGAPKSLRVVEAEERLRGQPFGKEAFAEAAERAAAAADPLEDWRGSADYKRKMVRVFTRRALEEARRRLRQP